MPQRYLPLPDQDGNFYIEAENVQNQDLEADYVIVHFAILYPQLIQDAAVYIYGKFTDWKLLPELKMTYDEVHKAYVGESVLKHGNYDYRYAVVSQDSSQVDLVTMQNNFYQTLNEYEIRFYFYDYNLMCFRFVGYQKVGAHL